MIQNKIDLADMGMMDAEMEGNEEAMAFWEGALDWLYHKYDDEMMAFNAADMAMRDAKFEQFTDQQAQDDEDAKNLDKDIEWLTADMEDLFAEADELYLEAAKMSPG